MKKDLKTKVKKFLGVEDQEKETEVKQTVKEQSPVLITKKLITEDGRQLLND